MKSSRVFSLLFFAALAAAAQTGTNSVATRPMSLTDCLQQALQQNFDVQIQRYNPQISLYDLRASYSGYDPTFNISGQHNYTVSPSRYQPVRRHQHPASVSDENSFNSGLTGELPCRDCNTLSAATSRRRMEIMEFRLTTLSAASA